MPGVGSRVWTAAAVTILAAACGSDDRSPGGGTDVPASDSYRVVVNPAALVVPRGENAHATLRLERKPGFSLPITIEARDLPPGISLAEAPITLGPDESEATVIFHADATAVVGSTTQAAVDGVAPPLRVGAPVELTVGGPPPDLDATFGAGGQARIGAGLSRDEHHAVVVQPDGKVVVAGSYRTGYLVYPALARYLPSGAIDTSFGQGGFVRFDNHPGSFAVGLALQPDGKLLVLEPEDFRVTRLDPSGAADRTFAGVGTARARFTTEATAHALVLQPDAKIVVAGRANPEGGAPGAFAVVRYLPDGTLDPGFASGGRASTPIGSPAREADAVALALETTGGTTTAILAAGSAAMAAGGREAIVVRYLEGGALDLAFDGDGILARTPGANVEERFAAITVAGGKVLLAGERTAAVGAATGTLVRLAATSGALDPSFGGGAGALDLAVGLGVGSDVHPRAVVLAASSILVAGSAAASGASAGAFVARLDDAGTLDPTFGVAGLVREGTSDTSSAAGLALDPSAAIVVAGSRTSGANGDGLVARYLAANGSPDPSWASGALVSTSYGPGDEDLRAVGLDADGRIVVAGSAYNGRDFDVLVARLLADGALDVSFGGRGFVTLDPTKTSEFGYDLRLLPDGAIAVTGQGGGGALALRLRASGELDPAFGIGGVASIPGGEGFAMALQGARVVIGGPGTDGNFFLARLGEDGKPDPTFGASGVVSTDFGLADRAVTLTVDAANRIVVAGHVDRGGPPNFFDLAVARYDGMNGRLDPAFDGDGRVLVDRTAVELTYAVATRPDGRVVLGGRMQTPGRSTSFGVLQLDASGAIDTSFGQGGRSAVDLGESSQASAILVEPSGTLLVAGRSSDARLALVQLSPSGLPVWTRGFTASAAGAEAEAFALARTTDGRILVVGVGQGAYEEQGVIARFLR